MAAKNVTLTRVGRRKSATARAYLKGAEKDFVATDAEPGVVINGRELTDYFKSSVTRMKVLRPIKLTERFGKYTFRISVNGGGTSGQAGAVIHAIARVLEKQEPELRPTLKKAGLLTRDSRKVERKKFGRRKARRSTQFSKR